MRLHGNAELSLNKRRRLASRVEQDGWTLTKAAQAAEVSVRTARKWVRRHRDEGEPGLLDRSSRPRSSPNATPEQRVQLIVLLRRSTRMTGAEIAEVLAMPITTVQGIGHRVTGRKHYTPRTGGRRQPRKNTVGWEFCHVAIDDFSRLAYVEVLGDERATTAVGFLHRALRF